MGTITAESIYGLPITGHCRVKDTDIFLPMIETNSDIKWVLGCIREREEHPENYPNEDIPAVIAQQKELLARLIEKAKEPPKPRPQAKAYMVIDLE